MGNELNNTTNDKLVGTDGADALFGYGGNDTISGEKGDAEFYTSLAVRAATSILSPFGWNEDAVAAGSMRQSSLEAWM